MNYPVYIDLFDSIEFFNLSPKCCLYTCESLRTPHAFIQTYRSIQLLILEFNALLSDYPLLICNNLMTSLAVFSITVMIKFHTWLELQVLIIFTMGTITTNIYILALYAMFGEINAVSKKLILVSFRTSRKHTKEDLVFKKFLASCKQYLGVHLSVFGVYTKPTSFRIIGKIIVYVVRLLMMTERLG